MLVTTSLRRSVLAAIAIVTILGTAGVTAGAATASIGVAGQARPAATAVHSAHLLADGPDDTPWGD